MNVQAVATAKRETTALREVGQQRKKALRARNRAKQIGVPVTDGE